MGSGGKQGLHCQVKIVDDNNQDLEAGRSGEVLVKGPNVLKEYWQDSEATGQSLKDGWFHTGDIGHFDDRGYLYIDDRKKDMIISGSENIYPAMLENILADCPGVLEASVVGKKDTKWGEAVVAVIVAEPEVELTQDVIIEHFEGRIGRFAMPRHVLFVDALPRNAMGKVLKDEIRALVNTNNELRDGTP
jgi:fatty-acyl-CoA synthase